MEAAQIIENYRLLIGIGSDLAHFAFGYRDIATVIHHSDVVKKLPLDEVIRVVETRMVQCCMSEDTK